MRPALRRAAYRRGANHWTLTHLLLVAAAFGGLVMAAYPVFEDVRSQTVAHEVIASMTAQTDETNDSRRMSVLKQAQYYNAGLSHAAFAMDNERLGGSGGGDTDVLELYDEDEVLSVDSYEQQLHWNGYPAMCWIEIPTLGIREPIFHGTSDEVLAQGVGHVEWSSLPVGGNPGNCVLAAHTGMQDKSMFDDLGLLRKGDVFVIHTLGDAYQYAVFSKEVVVPREAKERCAIPDSGDECTLMTCTPYGINSHRLLVHARRVAFTNAVSSKALTSTTTHARLGISHRRVRPILFAAVGLIMPSLLHMVSKLCGTFTGLSQQARQHHAGRIRSSCRRASLA